MKLFCCRTSHPRSQIGRGATVSPHAAVFLAGLSPARRAEVASRPRFYRIPWLRRANEPDPDDTLF